MTDIKNFILVVAVTVCCAFAFAPAANACGPYDPVGMATMQVSWANEDIDSAILRLSKALKAGKMIEAVKAARDAREAGERLRVAKATLAEVKSVDSKVARR